MVPVQGMEGGLTASRVPQYPNIWTDDSLVSGVFAHVSGFVVGGEHLDLLPYDPELGVERCSLYFSLPGPLQTVQRAERSGVILALQALAPFHLGVNSTKVVRQCLSYSFWCLTGAPPGAVY